MHWCGGFLIVLLVVCALGDSRAELLSITASNTTHYLYDSLGRVRLFHGVNIVEKQFPWYDVSLLKYDVVAQLAAVGVNVVRVGFMWTGAEPTPGQFNMTYYEIMRSIVTNLADHGIYALLDVHQDCLSALFCLYDGFPPWVIKKSIPHRAFPWPFHGPCSSRAWATNELTEAAGQV